MTRRHETVGPVLALLTIGAALGQRDTGFQVDGWVLLFWVPAGILAVWRLMSHILHTPYQEPSMVPNVMFDRVEHCDITLNAPNGHEIHVWNCGSRIDLTFSGRSQRLTS